MGERPVPEIILPHKGKMAQARVGEKINFVNELSTREAKSAVGYSVVYKNFVILLNFV